MGRRTCQGCSDLNATWQALLRQVELLRTARRLLARHSYRQLLAQLPCADQRSVQCIVQRSGRSRQALTVVCAHDCVHVVLAHVMALALALQRCR